MNIGMIKCEHLIKKLRETNKNEFSAQEIKILIAKEIGMSILTQNRYFYNLKVFGFIKQLDSGKYAVA
jgi:hypothetical protein